MEQEPNIGKCLHPLSTEVCNIIFQDAPCGVLQWEKKDLKQAGDWWDSAFGRDIALGDEHTVLLYCEQNPALEYSHIECVLRVHRSLANTGHDMVIQDLTFCNNGVHGIAGEQPVKNLLISNCRFEYIGGCVWDKAQKIRFGNGVECWNVAENVTVEQCAFHEIYDSGVTHQGGRECKAADGFWIRNNFFNACGMAAYEQRDVLPLKGEFVNNVCVNAGNGFSHFRTPLPRMSEIWPQPMGHHIFLWRIENTTEGSQFAIQRNVFGDAHYGSAIYSIISKKSHDQLLIGNNVYIENKKYKIE